MTYWARLLVKYLFMATNLQRVCCWLDIADNFSFIRLARQNRKNGSSGLCMLFVVEEHVAAYLTEPQEQVVVLSPLLMSGGLEGD